MTERPTGEPTPTRVEAITEPGSYAISPDTRGVLYGFPPDFSLATRTAFEKQFPNSFFVVVKRHPGGVDFLIEPGWGHSYGRSEGFLMAGDNVARVQEETHGGGWEDLNSETKELILSDSGLPRLEKGKVLTTHTRRNGEVIVRTYHSWDEEDEIPIGGSDKWNMQIEVKGSRQGAMVKAGIAVLNQMVRERNLPLWRIR